MRATSTVVVTDHIIIYPPPGPTSFRGSRNMYIHVDGDRICMIIHYNCSF